MPPPRRFVFDDGSEMDLPDNFDVGDLASEMSYRSPEEIARDTRPRLPPVRAPLDEYGVPRWSYRDAGPALAYAGETRAPSGYVPPSRLDVDLSGIPVPPPRARPAPRRPPPIVISDGAIRATEEAEDAADAAMMERLRAEAAAERAELPPTETPGWVLGEAGTPPPAIPGHEWVAGDTAAGRMLFRSVPVDSPEGRAIAEARAANETRAALPGLTASPEEIDLLRRIDDAEMNDITASPEEIDLLRRIDDAEMNDITASPEAMAEALGRTGESDEPRAVTGPITARVDESRGILGSIEDFVRENIIGTDDALSDEDLAALLSDEAASGDVAPTSVPGGPAPAPRGGATRGGARRGGGRVPVAAPAEPVAPPTSAQGGANPMLARALARNDDALDLARHRAESEVAGLADSRAAMRDAERARLENEDARRRAMGEARDRYRRAMENATAMTLDPEGWYHDRGVLGTVAAAIAVAMGSIGSSITGGTNEALGIINASIERDLEAQRMAIDQGHARAEGEANLMDMLDSEFQSRDAAVAAARAAMLEDVANRVAAESAGMATEEARLAAEEMHDELINQANAAANAAVEAEQDRMIDLYLREGEAREQMADALRAERRAMGGGGGGPSPITAAQMDVFNRDLATTGSREHAASVAGIDVSLAPADGPFAESSSTAEMADVSELEISLDTIDAMLPPVGDDIPGHGLTHGLPWWLVSDEGNNLRAEIDNAMDILARLRTGAAMPEHEVARYEHILQTAQTDDALRNGLARIRRSIEARRVRPHGASAEERTSAAAAGAVEVD